MSTNLEYRARERQRKRESRRQASETQRGKDRQRSRARDKNQRRLLFYVPVFPAIRSCPCTKMFATQSSWTRSSAYFSHAPYCKGHGRAYAGFPLQASLWQARHPPVCPGREVHNPRSCFLPPSHPWGPWPRWHLYARIFFTDFSKGFDLVDHNILIQEMELLGVHEATIRWIGSFLRDRSQRVQVSQVYSHPVTPNGGIPQGTKLAPLLFAISVNNLCRDWRYRIKYVDDTSVFESIPRCFGRGKKMENIVWQAWQKQFTSNLLLLLRWLRHWYWSI